MTTCHSYRTAYQFDQHLSRPRLDRQLTRDEYYQWALQAPGSPLWEEMTKANHPLADPERESWHFQAYYRAEYQWLTHGTPPYKLYPDLFYAMLHTSLDIPGEELPAPYESFVLHLPNVDHPLCTHFPALLVNFYDLSLPAARRPPWQDKRADQSPPLQGQLCLFWHFLDEHCYSFTMRPIASGQTLSHSLLKPCVRPTGPIQYQELFPDLYRIIIATLLFGIHRHQLVLPEIPYPTMQRRGRGSAHLQAQSDARQAARNTHWTVGKEIHLPRPLVHALESTPSGQHLTHSHLRSGHLRHQAHGPRHTLRKLLFIPPTLVRADLPTTPTPRTYAVKGSP